MRFSADTSPKLNQGHDVLEVLAKERQTLEELTNLATQVRDALICCDVTRLECLAGRQEILARCLMELGASRQELLEEWLAQDKRELKSRSVQDGNEGNRLLAACEGIREQAKALQRANAINHQLLAGMARWMNGLLDAFVALFEEAAPYDQHGLRPVYLESNLLMDHRV